MKSRFNYKNKIEYVLHDGKNLYKLDKLKDMLLYLDKVKELLKENDKKNIIYCVSRKEAKSKMGKRFKVYMLVNETFDNENELKKAIKEYDEEGYEVFYVE